jgi:catechol-2,3-dioxygenase
LSYGSDGKSFDNQNSQSTDAFVAYSEVFVALASSQLSRQTAFYRQFLQTEPTLSTATYTEFRVRGLRLAIFVPKAGNEAEFAAAGGAMSLCLEVQNLANAIAHLQTLGYPPLGDIMNTSHGPEIYAYDPDGNRLILHQSQSHQSQSNQSQ